MSRQKLFISHAFKDKELAEAVIDLLKTGTRLTSLDVVYSALGERGVPDGKDFSSYIESQIQSPAAAIVLLSPNYFANRYSLCEMGAVLALTQNIMPLLVPPLTQKHLQGVFSASQIDKIDNTDDLNKFVAKLQRHLDLGDLNLQQWAMKKKQFLTALPTLMDKNSAK